MSIRSTAIAMVALLTVAALFATVVFGGEGTSSAQSDGINILFDPGFVELAAGDSGTAVIEATNLPVGQADTVQVNLEFDPARIAITAARCIGLYSGASATALVELNGGTSVTFACAGTGLPGSSAGSIAEIDITHVSAGETTVSFGTTGQFRTAFINAASEQPIQSFGTLTVTDKDITAGFEFSTGSVTLGDNASVTLDIVSGLIMPGVASGVQVSIVHDVNVITIDAVSCKDLYQGATLAGPARVEGDTATSFSCSLGGAPFGELGPVAEVTLTRVGPGDATLSFLASGPFRTVFIDQGIEISQGRLETLTVLDVAPTPTPAPTATTPPSGGGGGGGGGGVPPPAQATATPLPAVPSSPQDVSVEPGDGSVTVTWETPSSNGGAPITGYRILSLTTGTPITVGSDVRSHTFAGLTNGVQYSYQITATNSSGNSEGVIVGPATPLATPASELDDAAQSAFGDDVEVTDPKPTVSTDDSGIRAVIGATGVTEGQTPTGGLSIETDDFILDVDETGAGSATLILGDELSVSGTVEVSGASDGIAIQFQEAQLLFSPVIEQSELAALPAVVGTPAVSFEVDLSSVADGAAVAATFSASVPDEIAAATFTLQGSTDPSSIDDLLSDIAYSVTVEKTALNNDQLGDNTVSMRVSAAWFDSMIDAGKDVVITKFDDDGGVFVERASCSVDGSDIVCTATFSGAAGGFSEFSLVGLTVLLVPQPSVTPTTTVPPRPATTPSPTSTPVAAPTIISAPTGPPTPVPTPVASPTKVAATPTPAPQPTATVRPTATPIPQIQILPTVPAGLGGGDSSGGGIPVWVFVLGGVMAVGALSLLVFRGIVRPLSLRS